MNSDNQPTAHEQAQLFDLVSATQTVLKQNTNFLAAPDISTIEAAAAKTIHFLGFPPSILAPAIAELTRRYSTHVSLTTLLSPAGKAPAVMTSGHGPFWARFKTQSLSQCSPITVDHHDSTTDLILSCLADPTQNIAQYAQGLVVGNVQSGKTMNYCALINKAIDKGYRLIVVLAGAHNNLRSQTDMRVAHDVAGYEVDPVNEVRNPIGVGLIDSTPITHRATRSDLDGDLNLVKSKALLRKSEPTLFVIKKNKSSLSAFLHWARTANVSDLPTLVIDDEADHFCIDTGDQPLLPDGKPDPDYEPKTINRLIRQVLKTFPVKSYVGYTATPFANVLIHRDAATQSEGPDLFPQDFIIQIPPPSNYAGALQYFGSPGSDGTRLNLLPLYRRISDVGSPSSWMPESHRQTHTPKHNSLQAIPPSLREAFHGFLLSCAARQARGQTDQHASMLVHVSKFANVQAHVRDQILDYISKIQKYYRINLTFAIDAFLSELRELWKSDFKPTISAVAGAVPDYALLAPLNWDDVLPHIQSNVMRMETKLINCSNPDELDYSSSKGLRIIAVGGDKLSRGLTLHGLCASYFCRCSKMYDTLMQMARWFGYRDGYLDLCRLHCSEELFASFCHIADADQELRKTFSDMAREGLSPSEFAFRVASHPILKVTSPQKMRNAKQLTLDLNGELLETVSLHPTTSIVDANLLAADELVCSLGSPDKTNFDVDLGLVKHHITGSIWTEVPATFVADFMQKYQTHPDSHKVDSKCIAQYISDKISSGELTHFSVAMLGGGSGPSHVFSNGLCSPPTTQRKALDNSDKTKYCFRRLLNPRDESIDFTPKEYQAALAVTSAVKGTGAAPTKPSGEAIRKIRGAGSHRTTAQLFIYPLDPQLSAPDIFGKRTAPVIAFGISFPTTDASKSKYVVDHLYWDKLHG